MNYCVSRVIGWSDTSDVLRYQWLSRSIRDCTKKRKHSVGNKWQLNIIICQNISCLFKGKVNGWVKYTTISLFIISFSLYLQGETLDVNIFALLPELFKWVWIIWGSAAPLHIKIHISTKKLSKGTSALICNVRAYLYEFSLLMYSLFKKYIYFSNEYQSNLRV